MFKHLHTRAILSAAVLALASLHSSAALVTSRGALGATGSLDWAQLGTDSASVTAPAAANTSIGGLTASVTNPGGAGTFTRFDEDAGTWKGKFASGAALLTTFGSGGSIQLDFNQGVSRVGAQIQGFDWETFDGVISAYNTLSGLLETYSVTDSAFDPLDFPTSDDSAIFLGLSRHSADINYVIFSISGPSNPDFAINQLSLSQQVTTQPPGVPEPASMALVALALTGLGLAGRRTKR